VTVVDTHAGAGVYDLEDTPAVKSREAAAGVLRLFEAGATTDPALSPLKQDVLALNPAGVRLYPGSPVLAARRLRPGDRLIACELRAEEADLLRTAMTRFTPTPTPGPEVLVRAVDGFVYAGGFACDPARSSLVLIDPPYELGDDYDRVIAAAARLMQQQPRPIVAIWAPIKDLETLDGLLRQLEELPDVGGYAAQVRLRPLVNPMRMNGCVMIVLGADETRAGAAAAAAAVADLCGEAGARGFAEGLHG
jgi:23S rRNA (adenine2030-N6)-methyltransferase